MWVENKNAPKPLLYLGGLGANIMAEKPRVRVARKAEKDVLMPN